MCQGQQEGTQMQNERNKYLLKHKFRGGARGVNSLETTPNSRRELSLQSRAVRYGQKIYITIFWIFFSISILITILTQTDMLYSYKCILCEFETFPKETN